MLVQGETFLFTCFRLLEINFLIPIILRMTFCLLYLDQNDTRYIERKIHNFSNVIIEILRRCHNIGINNIFFNFN